jgi:hypothetical protein
MQLSPRQEQGIITNLTSLPHQSPVYPSGPQLTKHMYRLRHSPNLSNRAGPSLVFSSVQSLVFMSLD